MPNGYTGRILHVDLTRGNLTIENPCDDFYRKYIGGSAMGVYYILKNTRGAPDPLGPDNVLTLMLSPFTGAPIAGQSRMTASAWSPRLSSHEDTSRCVSASHWMESARAANDRERVVAVGGWHR